MKLLRVSSVVSLVVAVGCSSVSGYDGSEAGGGGGRAGGNADGAAGDVGLPASDGPADVRDGAVEDAASDGGAATGWPFVGLRSYDVLSTLTPVGDAGRYGPPSHSFTLVIDGDNHTAIVGSTKVSFSVDGGALRFKGQINFGSWSSGGWAVSYADGLTVRLAAGGTLTGTGQGTGTTIYSDTGQSGPVTAVLSGGPDIVAPVLSVTIDGAADDPFSSLTVTSSEALPLGATPRLFGASGFEVSFLAATSNGDFVTYFYGPSLLRPYGQTYTVSIDGIADFAGHPAMAMGATSFTTRAAPPLVTEDGFESATGTALGGAEILSGAGAAGITGTRALYIPPISSPGPPGPRPRLTRVAVRLAVAPGDSVVRFAYRLVNQNGFGGLSFLLGSQGGTLSHKDVSGDAASPTTVTLPNGSQVQVGAIAIAEIPLPPNAGGEVVFTEQVPSAGGGLPPPPVPGIIIDDLRVEP